MRIILFIYAFLMPYAVCTAQLINKVIANKESRNAIAFVTIVYKSNFKNGTYSDELGKFTISKIDGDTLIFSCIGFHSQSISVDKLTAIDTLFLLPIVYALPEVIVKPFDKKGKSQLRVLGYYSLPKSNISQGGIKGQKVMVRIFNQTDGSPHQIISLNFRMTNIASDREKTSKGMVRICLYGMDDNCNDPGNNLLGKDIVYTVDKGKHRLEVDISDLNVFLPPCGVYVGLEWIGEKESSKMYNIQPGYERVGVSGSEHLVYYESFGRKLKSEVTNNSKTGVPMFGIEIN